MDYEKYLQHLPLCELLQELPVHLSPNQIIIAKQKQKCTCGLNEVKQFLKKRVFTPEQLKKIASDAFNAGANLFKFK